MSDERFKKASAPPARTEGEAIVPSSWVAPTPDRAATTFELRVLGIPVEVVPAAHSPLDLNPNNATKTKEELTKALRHDLRDQAFFSGARLKMEKFVETATPDQLISEVKEFLLHPETSYLGKNFGFRGGPGGSRTLLETMIDLREISRAEFRTILTSSNRNGISDSIPYGSLTETARKDVLETGIDALFSDSLRDKSYGRMALAGVVSHSPDSMPEVAAAFQAKIDQSGLPVAVITDTLSMIANLKSEAIGSALGPLLVPPDLCTTSTTSPRAARMLLAAIKDAAPYLDQGTATRMIEALCKEKNADGSLSKQDFDGPLNALLKRIDHTEVDGQVVEDLLANAIESGSPDYVDLLVRGKEGSSEKLKMLISVLDRTDASSSQRDRAAEKISALVEEDKTLAPALYYRLFRTTKEIPNNPTSTIDLFNPTPRSLQLLHTLARHVSSLSDSETSLPPSDRAALSPENIAFLLPPTTGRTVDMPHAVAVAQIVHKHFSAIPGALRE